MKIFFFFLVLVLSTSAFAIKSDVRDAKIKKINEAFVEDVVKATKLKASEVREFLPGARNHGKRISDTFKLTTAQKSAVRQLEDKRRNDMFNIRKRFGADPAVSKPVQNGAEKKTKKKKK